MGTIALWKEDIFKTDKRNLVMDITVLQPEVKFKNAYLGGVSQSLDILVLGGCHCHYSSGNCQV